MTGEPDLTIAGLRIWVHGRQFPELMDDWDGNWLVISAQCIAEGAQIFVRGPILHLSEVSCFLKACEAMYETLQGSASFPCMEPNLRVQLEAKAHGHIFLTIDITPDHLSQWHKFEFQADQTFLPTIIAGCKNLLKDYPLRGVLNIPNNDKGSKRLRSDNPATKSRFRGITLRLFRCVVGCCLRSRVHRKSEAKSSQQVLSEYRLDLTEETQGP